MKCLFNLIFSITTLFTYSVFGNSSDTELWKNKITVIPYPQEVNVSGSNFELNEILEIYLAKNAGKDELFIANDLQAHLKEKWDLNCTINEGNNTSSAIILTIENMADLPDQGYILEVNDKKVRIKANNPVGLFYGVQTFIQLIKQDESGLFVKGMTIKDWPDIPIRAVHYDTKHFQENKEYVKNFIRTLSYYKINMLIWEWEDKFEYKSHPEVRRTRSFHKRRDTGINRLC